MRSLPVNSVQSQRSTIADTVAKRLNQLPLQTQQQVLDFVEFLLHKQLHKHQSGKAARPFHTSLEEDLTCWEASTDEDWLALEAELAAAKDS